MEYLYVKFREQRRVLLEDGTEAGDTNKTLKMQLATYTISLSDPQDYVPPSQEVTLAGTSEDNPKRIEFT